MSSEKRTQRVCARITPKAASALDAVCFSDDRRRSYVINKALEDMADRQAGKGAGGGGGAAAGAAPGKATEPPRKKPRPAPGGAVKPERR